MNKQEIIDKIKELGISSENAFPKSSFAKNGIIYVAFYERELKEDFYFFNTFDKKIYKNTPKDIKKLETDNFKNSVKYLVPLDECIVVWEDKPYVELVDEPFGSMTLRQYACIHLKVPESGLDWLDNIIKKS